MSPEELISLKKGIVMTAAYYDKTYSDGTIAMMADDLKDYPLADVASAYRKYRTDPKNRTMPLPAQIIAILQPSLNHDAKAREVASRIPAAIVKFGYSNPAEAQAFIGEVGWDVVQSSGGWSYLCQNHGITIDPGQFMAQTRDRLKDRFEYGKQAIHSQVIEHRPKDDQLMIERDTQKARLEKWQLDEIEKNKKPDPNEGYVARTQEERDQIVKDFIAKINAKKGLA
jgi:hypothetical protein